MHQECEADTMWGKVLLWLPPAITEEPSQALVNVAALLAGLGDILTRGHIAPESLTQSFPTATTIGWGVFLVVGGAIRLLGLFARGTRFDRHAHDLERIGSCLVGPAALAYSLLLLWRGAWYSGGLTLAFGLGVIVRAAVLRPGIYAVFLRRELNRQIGQVLGADSRSDR